MISSDSVAATQSGTAQTPTPVTSGTGDGLIAFLEHVQAKGYMAATTASALRTGCTKVLEAVPELRTEDLRSIDMDERLLQFRNKSKGRYADKTLDAYRKRFEQSVSMYCRWLVDDKDWLTVRPRRQSPNRQTVPTVTAARPDVQDPSDTGGKPDQRTSAMITYPLPLRSGIKATLILPEDLTDREAARVSQFVKALAFENPAGGSDSEGR